MRPRGVLHDAVGLAARAGGAVLQTATRTVSAVRSAPKPLHPRGTVWEAEVVRTGSPAPTGVPWLDEPGRERAIVRVSAAFGFPHGWPDIQGLAIRLPEQGEADLLLASTGSGRLTRFVLRPVKSSGRHLSTTLLPYRGPKGPIWVAAEPAEPGHHVLSFSTGEGDWIAFATLRLISESEQEPSFDPIRRPLPGLANYTWVSRLRAPAYRAARRDRDEGTASTGS